MNCPACKHTMIAVEMNDIETDICTQCGGTWLDAGELELLLDGAINRDTLLKSLNPVVLNAEPQRDCPICDKTMQHVVCASGAEKDDIVIDKCPRNDGLWFDKGELNQVIALGDFPADHRIYELLDGILGNQEVSEGGRQ